MNEITPVTPDSGGTPEAAPSSRPFARIRRTLAILYLLLLAILVVSAYLIIHNTRENALSAARQNNQMLARILEEHMARTFGEVDKVIHATAEKFAEHGGLSRFNEKTVHEQLKGRMADLPQVASLGTALPDGKILARAAEYPGRPSNISDRDDFIYLRDHAEDAPYIGSLTRNPFGPGHLIHISRRITLPDGRFGGIVRGAVATEYLVRFYADLQLPPDTIIALVKPDGNPIFRHPFVENLKQFNIAATTAFKDGRPASRMGIFIRVFPINGREHIVAYRWFADESLGVFVGTPTAGTLAASDNYAMRVIASGLLIAVVFGALLRLIFRNLRREESLSRQLTFAQHAIDNAEDMIIWIDPMGTIRYANRSACRGHGLPEGSLDGKHVSAINPNATPEALALFWRNLRERGTFRATITHARANGERFHLESVAHLSHFMGEELYCAILRDVSEKEKNLAALQIRDAALSTSLSAIALADGEGRLSYVNDAFLRMWGYARAEEVIGRSATEFWTKPEEAAAVIAHLQRDKTWTGELTGLRADGREINAQLLANVVEDDKGRLLCLMGSFIDVTEPRAIEQALRASEARLREAQRLAHVGNWEHDLLDHTLFWSDEIFRIFEIDPRQYDASYETFLATVHPQDRDKVNRAYRESVERHSFYDIAHRLLFPDGRIKHVREHGESYYAEDGTPLRSVGTVQDITEQVLAEQEIRALNESLERRVATRTDELAQANRELESFSYSVSHDLRAPLRAINGFSRILQDSEEFALSAESRELLDRIVRNTNRMGDLIDDILDYSRASQSALNRKEVDLTPLARATYDEHAPSYPNATVRIGQLGAVWGDPAMLRQVFDNLVANALKYSSKRERAEIEIGARDEPGGTVFFVRDNGAGFDMQYAGKLFGMFQRMHTDKEFPGTGVGLAIVKRIVERHGGRIWAEAAPDAGATFYFTLPRNS